MIIRDNKKGFTLVEVLVALIILAIGLLGMATLMMASLQSSQDAYLRSQASMLTYDIVERMRANHDQAVTSDDYTLAANAATPSNPGCKVSGCTTSEQAQQDMYDWRMALAASIPDAKAKIIRANLNEYTIEIEWQGAGVELTNNALSSFNLRVDL